MIFAIDGKGKTDEAAIYECTCSEYREARLEIGGTGWIAGTNHYRLFDFDAPQGSDSSQRRYRRMQEMLAALMSRDRAPDFPDDLIAILADPAVEVRGADYGTVYAAVACPGAAQMWTTLGGYPAASAGRWQLAAVALALGVADGGGGGRHGSVGYAGEREPRGVWPLYERHVKGIYNYHYRHTSNVEVAEDLTSRTFYKALRYLHRYRDQKNASFRSWLYRIAHNLVVNWYRDTSRHPEVSLQQAGTLRSDQSSPHQFVEKVEERERLLSLIEQLPEDRKTLIILKFVAEMTNAEIGDVLGRTEGAIKSLYYRTLASLRDAADVEGA